MTDFIKLAAKLVHAYQKSKISDDFARHLSEDPAAFYSPEEVEFLWELIDAAFDAGTMAEVP